MIDWESDKTRLALAELQTFVTKRGRDSRVVRWAFAYRALRNKIWWVWRRRLLSWLSKAPPKDGRLHVFWHLRGGLGDCAAHRVAVQAWREKLPNAVFYFYTDEPGAGKALFESDDRHVVLSGRDALWSRYDLAFELCISFKTVHVDWKRIKALAPAVVPWVEKSLSRQQKLSFFVQDNYFMDDVLGRLIYRAGESQLSAQRYLSGLDFDVNTTGILPSSLLNADILNRYGLRGKKYITIHSGINSQIPLYGKWPLKCWPTKEWREFARLFKTKFPDILLVQLGSSRSPVFDFADVSLVGKTKLEELPALLEGALLHVDGESGFVQLTRWLSTRAVVLFANTARSCFGLDKNKNIDNPVCDHCIWLVGARWYTDCALGYPSCRNWEKITPQLVFAAAAEALEEKLK